MPNKLIDSILTNKIFFLKGRSKKQRIARAAAVKLVPTFKKNRDYLLREIYKAGKAEGGRVHETTASIEGFSREPFEILESASTHLTLLDANVPDYAQKKVSKVLVAFNRNKIDESQAVRQLIKIGFSRENAKKCVERQQHNLRAVLSEIPVIFDWLDSRN